MWNSRQVNWVIREARLSDTEATIHLYNPSVEALLYTVLATRLSLQPQQSFMSDFSQRKIVHVAICSNKQKPVSCQDVESFATCTSGFTYAQ